MRFLASNNQMYFYHPDHLGSASFITDFEGGVEQHLQYMPYGELFVSQSLNGYDARYKFTGKERDEETAYDYFGARYYDSDLSQWLSVDPMADQRSWVSPYSYCQNNPMNRIDPTGALDFIDDYVFNEKGDFVRIDRNNNPDKLVVENSKTGDKQYYDFADPVNDTKDIENKVITKIVFVSDKQIKSMLNSQDAFESGMFNFGWESQGGGDFDYSFTVLPNIYPNANFDGSKSNSLFIPEGDYMAHNFMNFGNYLWGATGYTVGFGYGELQSGAHFNSLFNSARNGYPSQWDSKDDQRSIIKGAFHAQTHDYRSLRK